MKQSRPARCERDLGGFHAVCGAQLQLVVTKNPTHSPYEELIVVRCHAGHIVSGDGVLTYDPPSTLNYDGDDYEQRSNWGAF